MRKSIYWNALVTEDINSELKDLRLPNHYTDSRLSASKIQKYKCFGRVTYYIVTKLEEVSGSFSSLSLNNTCRFKVQGQRWWTWCSRICESLRTYCLGWRGSSYITFYFCVGGLRRLHDLLSYPRMSLNYLYQILYRLGEPFLQISRDRHWPVVSQGNLHKGVLESCDEWCHTTQFHSAMLDSIIGNSAAAASFTAIVETHQDIIEECLQCQRRSERSWV